MTNPFTEFFGGELPTETDTTPIAQTERRVVGKITKVDEGGWGFISCKEIPFTRIFYHWTSLRQDTLRFQQLKNGMKVEFTPIEVEGKGWRAIKITVIKNGINGEPKSA